MTQPSAAAPIETQPPSNRWTRALLSDYFGLALTVILLIALAPFTPGLLSQSNLLNIFSRSSSSRSA